MEDAPILTGRAGPHNGLDLLSPAARSILLGMLPQALALVVALLLPAPEIRLERWPDGKPKAEYEVRIEADGSEVRHGSWKAWFENGKEGDEGTYADGVRVGEWTLRWPNGKRRATGAFVDGLREGEWKLYHEKGPKAGEGSYAAGRRTGPWRFWGSDRELDAARSGDYEPVDLTPGAFGATVQGTNLDGRPMGLWTWRRADGSLRLAGEYGPDGPEGAWVAVLADGSLDAQQSGQYAAGERTGALEGWPDQVEELQADLAPDPRRAAPLQVDAEVAAALAQWLGADSGAREGPFRALRDAPQAGFAACVAYLQGVDPAQPDAQARRVADEALPALIGLAFPFEDDARENALRALVWRDHVEFGDFESAAWRCMFDPRWRGESITVANTPLARLAEPAGWRASAPGGHARAGLRLLGRHGDREAALKANGGGADTERAVARGLAWLARLQTPNGSWEHGTPRTLEASAWALLALAGEGVGPFDEGETAQAIAKGLTWLLAQQRGASGRFATSLCRDIRSHALALWAAAELDAHQPLPGLDAAVVRGQAALIAGGVGDGSYPRDEGGREGDVLTTLYAAYALRVRADVGDEDAAVAAARALEWLAARAGADGSLPEPERRSPAATAASAHLRILSGLDVDRDALLGRQVGWIVGHPSTLELGHPQLDAEYLLFGAWTCAQVGGDVWSEWNKAMKVQLLQVQRHSGEQDGSWEPVGIGPLDRTSVTSQRVLTFQTYYRYATPAR